MTTHVSKKKVLIVEDEISLRSVLHKELVREKFEVYEAGDGVEGLEIALEKKPDVILLDILMPKMDGMTMAKRLHEDEWGKNVPIIFLTNNDDPGFVSDALKQGVYQYLIKSNWKLEDVVGKVKAVLV